jgi:hypothetical protein
MSDEPKRRPRAWIGWAVAALIVLYPLSIGPILGYRIHRIHYRIFRTLYSPIMEAAQKNLQCREALQRYLRLWGVELQFSD